MKKMWRSELDMTGYKKSRWTPQADGGRAGFGSVSQVSCLTKPVRLGGGPEDLLNQNRRRLSASHKARTHGGIYSIGVSGHVASLVRSSFRTRSAEADQASGFFASMMQKGRLKITSAWSRRAIAPGTFSVERVRMLRSERRPVCARNHFSQKAPLFVQARLRFTHAAPHIMHAAVHPSRETEPVLHEME